MTSIDMQFWLVIGSVGCVLWALLRLREERRAWKEDEAMMSRWLKEGRELRGKLAQKLLANVEAHAKWLEAAKKNALRFKKEIATLKGQNTRLKKKLEALSGK